MNCLKPKEKPGLVVMRPLVTAGRCQRRRVSWEVPSVGGLSGVHFSWGAPSSEIPEVRHLGRDCWLREQLIGWLGSQ